MPSLNNVRIKPKLISLFLLVGLIPVAIVGWFSAQQADKALLKASFNQLESVRDIKKSQLKNYLDGIVNNMTSLKNVVSNIQTETYNKLDAVSSIKKAQMEMYFFFRENDINTLAASPHVINALTDFDSAFTNNAVNSVDTPEWKANDKEYLPWFNKYVKDYGYYDLFLISNDGNVVFSQAKESDLGENLITGKLQNSGLGKVFKQALNGYAIADFEPYAPSNGAQAAFIASPVIVDGEVEI